MSDETRKLTASELLALLAEKAPALRKAGVLEVAIDGFRAKLAAPDYEPDGEDEKPKPEERLNALDDPRTFGLPAGSTIPSRSSRIISDEDEHGRGSGS